MEAHLFRVFRRLQHSQNKHVAESDLFWLMLCVCFPLHYTARIHIVLLFTNTFLSFLRLIIHSQTSPFDLPSFSDSVYPLLLPPLFLPSPSLASLCWDLSSPSRSASSPKSQLAPPPDLSPSSLHLSLISTPPCFTSMLQTAGGTSLPKSLSAVYARPSHPQSPSIYKPKGREQQLDRRVGKAGSLKTCFGACDLCHLKDFSL